MAARSRKLRDANFRDDGLDAIYVGPGRKGVTAHRLAPHHVAGA
jgi:hypothetical protein